MKESFILGLKQKKQTPGVCFLNPKDERIIHESDRIPPSPKKQCYNFCIRNLI